MKVIDLLNISEGLHPVNQNHKGLSWDMLTKLNDNGYLKQIDEFQNKNIEIIDADFKLLSFDMTNEGIRPNIQTNYDIIDIECDPQTDLNENIKLFGITQLPDGKIIYRVTKDSLKNK